MDGEDIKRRWKEYTEYLYKEEENMTERFEDETCELEPDIMESEVRWSLKVTAKRKA